MRDAEIRGALLSQLSERFEGDTIRNEMGLCLGQTRVDVAVVNGALHGYEIKSERDTLARLAGQVQIYGRVLDFASVVTSGKHSERVLGLIPDWWGHVHAVETDDGVHLEERRRAERNLDPDPLSIAQLLWRDEAAAVLVDRGEVVRARETRWMLWDRLALLDLTELQDIVRSCLKARRDWPGG